MADSSVLRRLKTVDISIKGSYSTKNVHVLNFKVQKCYKYCRHNALYNSANNNYTICTMCNGEVNTIGQPCFLLKE